MLSMYRIINEGARPVSDRKGIYWDLCGSSWQDVFTLCTLEAQAYGGREQGNLEMSPVLRNTDVTPVSQKSLH